MELLEFHLNLLVSLVGEINYLSAYNTKKKKALDFVVVFFFMQDLGQFISLLLFLGF